MSCAAELTVAIENSFSPKPTVIVLDSVTETKKWMSEQTPSIHDHLKAHLFKFERNEVGECRMFFKEWSTDLFWLPQTGLAFLPSNNAVPKQRPLLSSPCYDPECLKKLQVTVKKVGAYLDKAGASEWWEQWLTEANKYVEHKEPQASEGESGTPC